jgi:hypothetical protein
VLAISNNVGQTVSASSTVYGTFCAAGNNTSQQTWTGGEGSRQMLSPVAGTLRRFYVRTTTAQPGDGALVLTVRVNGADTGIVITIAAGASAGTFSDAAHTASVSAGDLISFSVTNAATATSANVQQWSIVLQ